MTGKQHHHDENKVLNNRQRDVEGAGFQADVLPEGLSPQQGLTGLPAGGNQVMRQAAAIRLQREQGNAAVGRLLNGTSDMVQREGPPDLPNAPHFNGQTFPPGASPPVITGDAPAPAGAAPAAGGEQGPTVMTKGGSTVEVTDGSVVLEAPVVDVRAAAINLDAAVTTASGVVQADTLVANTVVGSSYTPGAGNLM